MANLCGMCHLLLLREVTQNLRLLSWLRGKIDERPRCANTTAVLTTDTRWRREQWLTEQYPRRRKSAPAARPRSLRRRSFSIGISRNAAVLPLDVSPAPERTALHGLKAIGTWPEHARLNGQKITLSATRPTRRNGVNEIRRDRKSTRLNSSHQIISYAVFCLKKKTQQYIELCTMCPL